MPADPYEKTRYQAAKQADEEMRRDKPWLWHFANVVTKPDRAAFMLARHDDFGRIGYTKGLRPW